MPEQKKSDRYWIEFCGKDFLDRVKHIGKARIRQMRLSGQTWREISQNLGFGGVQEFGMKACEYAGITE